MMARLMEWLGWAHEAPKRSNIDREVYARFQRAREQNESLAMDTCSAHMRSLSQTNQARQALEEMAKRAGE